MDEIGNTSDKSERNFCWGLEENLGINWKNFRENFEKIIKIENKT